LLRKMINPFQLRAPEELSELCNSAHKQDRATLGGAAHRLRGLVSMFSSSIADMLMDLEQLALDRCVFDESSLIAAAHRCGMITEQMKELSGMLSGLTVDDLHRRCAMLSESAANECSRTC
jgi:hypothetical protein